MAFIDRKITNTEIDAHKVTDRPDTLNDQPETTKGWFDDLPVNFIIPAINGVIDDLVAVTDGASGADNIGATPIISGGANTTQGIFDELFSRIYPVGCIYMSVSSANPSTHFGGTWAAWAVGKTPIGMGNNGTTNYSTVNATGGADTKTIAKANLPSYNMDVKTASGYKIGMETGTDAGILKVAYTGLTALANTTLLVATGGSGTALNVVSAYQTCYMWERTA